MFKFSGNHMNHAFLRGIALLIFVWLLSSCGGGGGGGSNAPASLAVTTVNIAAGKTLLALQESETLTAQAFDVNGAAVVGQTVTWSSSNASVATVSASGVVTPVSAGQVTINASVAGRLGSVALQTVWAVSDVDFSNATSVKSASGLLHGLNFTGQSTPGDSLITPLGPTYWRSTPNVVPTARAHALGANYNVILSDTWGYPVDGWVKGRPWVDTAAYSTFMHQVVSSLQGQADVWEIWNEPDQAYGSNFWDGTEQQFFDTYLLTYQIIRQTLGPDVLIAGPSITNYDEGFLDRFAAFCIANGCQANVLSWHENGGTAPIQSIAQKLKRARTRYTSGANAALGVKEIHIQEYGSPTQTHSPATSLLYMQYIEQGGADHAARACWPNASNISECFDNSLDGLIAPADFSPRSVWWAYRLYAQGVASRVASQASRGQMVSIASRLPGTATTLPTVMSAQVLTGVGNVDAAPVAPIIGLRLTGLASLPGVQGNAMHVDIYRVLPSGELAAPAPVLLSTQAVGVVNGIASVLIGEIPLDAMIQVVIRP